MFSVPCCLRSPVFYVVSWSNKSLSTWLYLRQREGTWGWDKVSYVSTEATWIKLKPLMHSLGDRRNVMGSATAPAISLQSIKPGVRQTLIAAWQAGGKLIDYSIIFYLLLLCWLCNSSLPLKWLCAKSRLNMNWHRRSKAVPKIHQSDLDYREKGASCCSE